MINDSVTKMELVSGKWVFIYWKTHDIGRLPIRLIKNVKNVEKEIKEKGWSGWVCNSEKDHTEMHKIIERMGGRVKYYPDPELYWFIKEINYV